MIHEGIDTRLAHPNPEVSFEVRGIRIDRTVPTITFVNRNLERLRGFDLFMRSLPLIHQQHSKVRVLIVGDNELVMAVGMVMAPPFASACFRSWQAKSIWIGSTSLGGCPIRC